MPSYLKWLNSKSKEDELHQKKKNKKNRKPRKIRYGTRNAKINSYIGGRRSIDI